MKQIQIWRTCPPLPKWENCLISSSRSIYQKVISPLNTLKGQKAHLLCAAPMLPACRDPEDVKPPLSVAYRSFQKLSAGRLFTGESFADLGSRDVRGVPLLDVREPAGNSSCRTNASVLTPPGNSPGNFFFFFN